METQSVWNALSELKKVSIESKRNGNMSFARSAGVISPVSIESKRNGN